LYPRWKEGWVEIVSTVRVEKLRTIEKNLRCAKVGKLPAADLVKSGKSLRQSANKYSRDLPCHVGNRPARVDFVLQAVSAVSQRIFRHHFNLARSFLSVGARLSPGRRPRVGPGRDFQFPRPRPFAPMMVVCR